MANVSNIKAPDGSSYDIRALAISMGKVDSTSTATAFTATIKGITSLYDGLCIWLTNGVVSSTTNYTLNINGLGAKPVYQSMARTSRTTTQFNVNYTMLFIYNSSRVSGGCWDMVYGYNTNTTYTPQSLGIGYGTCDTAAETINKIATLTSYGLITNGIVAIKFIEDVPANATLNINAKGKKDIYYRGKAITADVIKAGDVATFIYSSQYHLIAVDRWGSDLENKVDIESGKGLSTNDFTNELKNKLDGIAEGAEKNPNNFIQVIVGNWGGPPTGYIVASNPQDTISIWAKSNLNIIKEGDKTVTLTALDEKVNQTENTDKKRPLLQANSASTTDDIAGVFKSADLTYDASAEELHAINLRIGEQTVSGKITFVQKNTGVDTVLQAETASTGSGVQLFLPAYSGTLATIEDVNKVSDKIDNKFDELYGYIGDYSNAVGIQIDFANKSWERLGAAKTDPQIFNSINAFAGRKLCSVTHDGTITYISDYTTAPSETNVMVEQPQFYYNVVPLSTRTLNNGTVVLDKANYWISDTPLTGFKMHPAFKNRQGDYSLHYYIGAWPINAVDGSDASPNSIYETSPGAGRRYNQDSYLTSWYGYQATSNQNKAYFRTGIQGTNTYKNLDWGMVSIQIASAEQLLQMIEYGPNLQTGLAKGVADITDETNKNCSCLSGSCFNLGVTSGEANSTSFNIEGTTSEQTESGKKSYSYRGVENFYGNIWEWIDGINALDRKVYICTDFNFDDNSFSENYIDTGITLPSSGGYIKSFAYNSEFDWLLITGEIGGNSNLPIGDYFNASTETRIAMLGGGWNGGVGAGPFDENFSRLVSDTIRSTGARLSYIKS